MKVRKTVQLGEFTYELQQFQPTKGYKIFLRTVKLVGEPLFQFVADSQKDVKAVLPHVGRILRESLNEDEFDFLLKEYMTCVFYKGQPVSPIFESHFEGRMKDIFKLLVEVMKHNYEDFLADFASELGSNLAKKAE